MCNWSQEGSIVTEVRQSGGRIKSQETGVIELMVLRVERDQVTLRHPDEFLMIV